MRPPIKSTRGQPGLRFGNVQTWLEEDASGTKSDLLHCFSLALIGFVFFFQRHPKASIRLEGAPDLFNPAPADLRFEMWGRWFVLQYDAKGHVYVLNFAPAIRPPGGAKRAGGVKRDWLQDEAAPAQAERLRARRTRRKLERVLLKVYKLPLQASVLLSQFGPMLQIMGAAAQAQLAKMWQWALSRVRRLPRVQILRTAVRTSLGHMNKNESVRTEAGATLAPRAYHIGDALLLVLQTFEQNTSLRPANLYSGPPTESERVLT